MTGWASASCPGHHRWNNSLAAVSPASPAPMAASSGAWAGDGGLGFKAEAQSAGFRRAAGLGRDSIRAGWLGGVDFCQSAYGWRKQIPDIRLMARRAISCPTALEWKAREADISRRSARRKLPTQNRRSKYSFHIQKRTSAYRGLGRGITLALPGRMLLVQARRQICRSSVKAHASLCLPSFLAAWPG